MALAAAYAIALQGLFAPLSALSAPQAFPGLVLCSGNPVPDDTSSGDRPAAVHHAACILACCAGVAVAPPPAERIGARQVEAAVTHLWAQDSQGHRSVVRTRFARAPPVG